ncbi:carbohydrate ABC transporter permease [Nostocoides sp. HKS02]|uniref:carbohydrate ABC transporter permease n=1 Tax=Nostocoides sp. HKS02 TaxID=1813880 RepID=UPI0012B5035D|nr:sugar ABC transporter permease [Tetrasphaera sp. HKS02]QGN59106.1 ABC transporter permease subunit [Tetrasphaera sp. HKS02]
MTIPADTQVRPRRFPWRRGRAWGGSTGTAYLFLAPGLVLFVTLIAYPVLLALRISFYDWKVVQGAVSPFVGLDQYTRALGDPILRKAAVNTVFYLVATVPAQLAIGMALALLLNRAIRGRVVFRALYYLPVITSWVVVSLVFEYLFNTQAGLVNHVLVDWLHVIGAPVDWLGSRWPALVTLSLLGIWKGVGWSMLIFLAALQAVPRELLDSAAVDGAGPVRQFFSVILPLLRPVVAFVTVMLVIGGFNVFISVFIMTGGGPANDTEVVLTYMYKQAFTFLDFGYGSAIAYLLALVIFALSFAQMRLFRYDQEVGS